MLKAFFAGASAAALLMVAMPAGAATGAGSQAAQALAQQLVTAAKNAEAADQGSGKSSVAIEADVEAAVLATIRDSAASPDVVAEALGLARKTPGLDNTVETALSSALQLALGVVVPGPGSSGRHWGPPPFNNGNGNGGGGGGSGYRGH